MLNLIPFKQLLNELNISYKALIIGVIGGYIRAVISSVCFSKKDTNLPSGL
jgi:uncharacterized YccA/Bax inhibitor family protein